LTKSEANVWLECGDCLEWMERIEAASVDLVLADLPYGATACAWDKRIPMEPLWAQYERVLKERGVILLFAQQPFTTDLIATGRKLFRYEWIWDKGAATGFANARRMPMRRHENILVFYRKLPAYHPQGLRPCVVKQRARRSDTAVYRHMAQPVAQRVTGYPQSIVAMRREAGAAPCQKPVALLEYLIRTYTAEGELVLDNAMGTGSTGVAALQCGRRFVGFELDGDRFDVAARRIKKSVRAGANYSAGPSGREI